MMFNVAPWQFAQAGGFGSLPGQYGQGIGGGQQGYSQPALAQLGLPPLVAACLAAEGAFASVLAQCGQQGIAQPGISGWLGQQQPGAQFQGGQGLGALPFFSQLVGPPGQQQYGQQGMGGWPGPYGQQGIGGLLGQQGHQQYGQQGLGGWPGQQQFAGGLIGQQGAFGQRGPGSPGGYLPFQVAPQLSYAG